MDRRESHEEPGLPTIDAGERQPRVRSVRAWIAAGLVALLLAAAVGIEIRAAAEYRASGDTHSPLRSRLAAAEAASSLNPYVRAYETRVITLKGLMLFDQGDILGAYDLLQREYVREAIANSFDTELAAAHAKVYLVYLQDSSRTAHVMHGLEQPNGTILPQDVQHFPRPPKTK
jgi:hypothetical protein